VGLIFSVIVSRAFTILSLACCVLAPPTSKVRHGSFETRLCAEEGKNSQRPPPDPSDPYCSGWSLHDRTAFLDRQRGEVARGGSGDPSKADFVFYYSHAKHGHGLPDGCCGMRLLVFSKDAHGHRVQSGRWERLDVGNLYESVAGDHHCFFLVSGDDDESHFVAASYIVDDKGQVTFQSDRLEFGESAWIQKDGQEFLWWMDSNSIVLRAADGRVVWSHHEPGEYYGSFFSEDRRYAFRTLRESTQSGMIYGHDPSDVWTFKFPFADEIAQKGLLGFNDRGEVILRVDRRIYRVSRDGTPRLAAVLPIYKGRHRSIETMRPGIHFDMDQYQGPIHTYEYATNVARTYDHPRPMLRFNISTFEAQESMDEGKHWRPVSIEAH